MTLTSRLRSPSLPSVRGTKLWTPGTQAALAFAGLILISRIALLVVLGHAIHHREFTNDTELHLELVRHPLHVLTGVMGDNGFAPLLGPLESAIGYPLQLALPDFYAIRGVYIAYDVATAFFLYLTLQRLPIGPRRRYLALAGYALLPAAWMMTVMAQEEGLLAFFLALVLWLVVTDQRWAALAVCGVGVATTKLFMLVPLAALILLLRVGRTWSRALVGLLPVIVTYGLSLGLVSWYGRGLPLLQFTPPSRSGVNLWTFANVHSYLSDGSAKRASTIATVVGLAAVMRLVYRPRGHEEARRLSEVFAVLFLWVFVLFYSIQPEYYVYLLPPLLLLVRGLRDLVLMAVLFAAPWAVNFAQGVEGAEHGGRTGGRQAFVHLARLVHLPLHASYEAALWTAIVATTAAAVALAVSLTRSPALSSPRPRVRSEGRSGVASNT